MGKDALVAFIIRQLSAPLADDGTEVELVDVRDGIAYVRYRKGHNPDCLGCVMEPEDLREFLLEGIRMKAPYITDVQLHIDS